MIPFTFRIFQKRDTNFVNQSFNVEGNTKSWDQLTREFCINDRSFSKWLQLTNAIPSNWSKNLKKLLRYLP